MSTNETAENIQLPYEPLKDCYFFSEVPTSKSLDATYPGRFLHKIGEDYSSSALEKVRFGVRLSSNVSKNISIELVERDIVVRRTSPFGEWEVFKQHIMRASTVGLETANAKGFQKVSLHYHNRVLIPAEEGGTRFEQYLNYFIASKNSKNEINPVSFIYGFSVRGDEFGDRLKVEFVSLGTKKSESSVYHLVGFKVCCSLDSIGDELVGIEKIADWLDSAHTRIHQEFENGVTDAMRATWKEPRQ